MQRIELLPARTAITLDDAILEGMKTFNNGCNFRLLMKQGKPFLTYGCYGVHVNLVQGKEAMLMDWYGIRNEEPKELPIHPETLCELLARIPCKECGGTRFEMGKNYDNQ